MTIRIYKQIKASLLVLPWIAASITTSIYAQETTNQTGGDSTSVPNECVDAATGELYVASSIECLKAMLKLEGVRKQLKDREMFPSIDNGSVSIKSLKFNVRAEEKVGVDFIGSTRSSIHAARNSAILGLAEIEALKNNPGFDIKTQTIENQGPIRAYNVSPQPPGGFPAPPPGWSTSPENPNYLDVVGFNSELHATLNNNVNGYAMKMRRKGETVGILQWNWSRNPGVGDAPAAGWNTDRRMHVASISKLMTTIGLIHLLDDNNIDTDDLIADFLPDYWDLGTNVDLITFEHLLNHASGLITGGSNSDWTTMKTTVELPVNSVLIGDYDNTNYENMNFGLMRILISTIGGYINTAADFGNEVVNDQLWDLITSAAYNHYMQNNVFNPHGAFPSLSKNTESTRAYTFSGNGSGWNSGSFIGRAGGMGWHMTITEILDVVRALREGKILSASNTSALLNQSWGLNSPVLGNSTAAGKTYYKAGLWTDNANQPLIARTEQSFVFMMPDDMELVIFVNSEVGNTNQSLSNIVRTVYANNIIEP